MDSVNIASAVAIIAVLTFSAASAEESGTNLGNVRGGDFHDAKNIILTKCQCLPVRSLLGSLRM